MLQNWFQVCVKDWSIVPDEIMKGTIDHLDDKIHLGASRRVTPWGHRHTICVWWTPHKMNSLVSDILGDCTTWLKPGKIRGSILWTSDINHRIIVEDPFCVDLVNVSDLMAVIHLMHHIKMLQPTEKEFYNLRLNVRDILRDAFSGESPKYLLSLKKAWVYKDYKKEFE